MERTNARYVERLPEPVSFVSVDASFISLKILLPVFRNWFPPEGGKAVTLIKPQFEAGRSEVSRGEGVIQDPTIHRMVLEEILRFTEGAGFQLLGLLRSPIKGPKGNSEFLLYLSFPFIEKADIVPFIDSALIPS
jgi:23S rRNA (cytidine1920-2'-O)/16S rRNA (cytidine1409-2'-O)-methyltransferase